MEDSGSLLQSIPWYFLQPPILQDPLATQTSSLQQQTVQECLPLLRGVDDLTRSPFDFNEYGIPKLEREDHINFLHQNLAQFPAPFVGVDASRPWMVYWGLIGLYLLGEDVSALRARVVKTVFPMQNSTGGLGGGHGQDSHLAGTYAALLSLALVGGEEAYGLIDRQKMWEWLGRLKQSDGGFLICEGGEEDVRGAYCALVALSLLRLPLALPPGAPARQAGLTTFKDGLGEYLSRCQTYEGGIASSPGNEAHGSYAFCVIACLCLYGTPDEALRRYLDVDALLSWLSSRQYAPEGGFAGRTNKVVDGCYSHWIGGCWPLVQAALNGPTPPSQGHKPDPLTIGNLYSSEGLARYILGCCQAPDGGLRDKPSKRPDSYHTCYTLAGISVVEHTHSYRDTSSSRTDDDFAPAFAWDASRHRETSEGVPGHDFDTGAGVKALHPVYVIPHEAVLAMRHWFATRPLQTDAT